MTTKEFLPYLKCVGTGPKRNRDLSKEEMKIVIRAFLKKEVIPEQIAAFILGSRVKGESIDEFGIEYKKSTQRITLEESLKETESPSEAFEKLAKLNAAVLSYLSNRTPSIEDAHISL